MSLQSAVGWRMSGDARRRTFELLDQSVAYEQSVLRCRPRRDPASSAKQGRMARACEVTYPPSGGITSLKVSKAYQGKEVQHETLC